MEARKEKHSWKRYFWKNLFSNYLRLILRVITGLVLFRLLFEYLSKEEFGFYQLLWSVFGCAIFLDFGLGITIQKVVAECLTTSDEGRINRVVSTVFWTFAFLASLLLCGFLLFEDPFLSQIGIKETDRQSIISAYRFFMVGVAITLPFGIFQEALRGMQRLDLVNWPYIISSLLNVALIPIALVLGWDFQYIVLISILTTLFSIMTTFFLVSRLLPNFSLAWRNIDFPSIKSTMTFSIIAYLNTCSIIIMTKIDAIVIGFGMGVASVALYQVGLKIAEIFYLFLIQLQELLSPASAEMRAEEDHEGMVRLLVRMNRFVIYLSTVCYAIAVAHLEAGLSLITGLDQIPLSSYWVAQALLLAMYSSILTNSCSRKAMIMWGMERALLRISLFEASTNLILSIILMIWIGIVGVALGTLIPGLIIGWLIMMPLLARFAKMGVFTLLKELFAPILLPVCLPLGVLAVLMVFFPTRPSHSLVDAFWHAAVVLAAAALMGKRLLTSMKN